MNEESKELKGTLLRAPGSREGIDAIAELAREAAEPQSIELDYPTFTIVPEGSKVEELDGSSYRPWYESEPSRPTGVAKPGTVDAFIDYVSQWPADQVTVWVPVTNGKIIAVLNDHTPDVNGWGDHRAELELTKTPEWLHWTQGDGKDGNQEEFATHLEDGMDEIVEPTAADMLEIAQSIHAKSDVNFTSKHRLDNGEVQFEYTEEIDAKAGTGGKLEIPSVFVLAIAPFIGEEPYKVKARLRYRLNSGNLIIGYRLIRPAAVLRDAYGRIADRFMGITRDPETKEETGDREPLFEHVYLGEPAGSRGIDSGASR